MTSEPIDIAAARFHADRHQQGTSVQELKNHLTTLGYLASSQRNIENMLLSMSRGNDGTERQTRGLVYFPSAQATLIVTTFDSLSITKATAQEARMEAVSNRRWIRWNFAVALLIPFAASYLQDKHFFSKKLDIIQPAAETATNQTFLYKAQNMPVEFVVPDGYVVSEEITGQGQQVIKMKRNGSLEIIVQQNDEYARYIVKSLTSDLDKAPTIEQITINGRDTTQIDTTDLLYPFESFLSTPIFVRAYILETPKYAYIVGINEYGASDGKTADLSGLDQVARSLVITDGMSDRDRDVVRSVKSRESGIFDIFSSKELPIPTGANNGWPSEQLVIARERVTGSYLFFLDVGGIHLQPPGISYRGKLIEEEIGVIDAKSISVQEDTGRNRVVRFNTLVKNKLLHWQIQLDSYDGLQLKRMN